MCKMPSKLRQAPDRASEKNQLKQAETQSKTQTGQGRAPAGAVTVSDIGSPYGSSDTQQSYESMDFGDAGEELI
jgi:hypothetical protein